VIYAKKAKAAKGNAKDEKYFYSTILDIFLHRLTGNGGLFYLWCQLALFTR
jgi:hypothetical protein